MIAVRTVDERTAASKSTLHQQAIAVGIDSFTGCHHLRPGNAVVQVTARIGRRRVKLKVLRRELGALGHFGLQGSKKRCVSSISGRTPS